MMISAKYRRYHDSSSLPADNFINLRYLFLLFPTTFINYFSFLCHGIHILVLDILHKKFPFAIYIHLLIYFPTSCIPFSILKDLLFRIFRTSKRNSLFKENNMPKFIAKYKQIKCSDDGYHEHELRYI